jgi:hypothetical protein
MEASSSSYDYRTSLKRVHGLVQQLQERGASAGGGAAAAAAATGGGAAGSTAQAAGALRYWKTNWRSMLALVTLYSIPTAAVTGLFVAERQKKVRGGRGWARCFACCF